MPGERRIRPPTNRKFPTWSLEGPGSGDGKEKSKEPKSSALGIG